MAYVDLDRDVVLLANSLVLPPHQHLWPNMPFDRISSFENNVFAVGVPTEVLHRIRYLAMSYMLWNGSARFKDMGGYLRSTGALKGLVLLDKPRKGERNYEWESRLEGISTQLGPELRERVKVLADEKQLKLALEAGRLWKLNFDGLYCGISRVEA
jgi:hypothetical protein